MYKNAFVNIYLACEKSGGGWSSAGGTVIRYNVKGDNSKEAGLDFALHDAGDFDAITNKWVHVVMVVKPRSIVTYDDGVKVADDAYGFYKYGGAGSNIAQPTPSNLSATLGNITLSTDIFFGGRADKNKDRHFRGKMALLQVLSSPVSDAEAECMFLSGDALLPSAIAIYRHSTCADMELDVTFIGDKADRSGNNHTLTLKGHAQVDADGAHFDGDGDYITVDNFVYSDDGTFTVALWMTKTACTTGIYEYAYSHNNKANASILSTSNTNVNMYIGCETSGGGWSTLGGSVVRFNLVDDAGTYATFDYPCTTRATLTPSRRCGCTLCWWWTRPGW